MASGHLLSACKNHCNYGCIFCLTGKELLVANAIEAQSPFIRARAVRRVTRHTQQGVTTLQDEVVLHGYVLFEAPWCLDLWDAIPRDTALSVLTYSDGDWRLFGDDENYAKWIFRYDGLIDLSNACQIGNRIQIIDGPLKDLEGRITKIDRRNRSGQVEINIGGRLQKVWLGFDIVKEYPEDEAIFTQRDN